MFPEFVLILAEPDLLNVDHIEIIEVPMKSMPMTNLKAFIDLNMDVDDMRLKLFLVRRH